jgi:hypothetical protein
LYAHRFVEISPPEEGHDMDLESASITWALEALILILTLCLLTIVAPVTLVAAMT